MVKHHMSFRRGPQRIRINIQHLFEMIASAALIPQVLRMQFYSTFFVTCSLLCVL
jgi:hypothetical protein